MKTIPARIKSEQANKLREIANFVPGVGISGAVQQAVDLWIEREGRFFLAAPREAQEKIAQNSEAIHGPRVVIREKSEEVTEGIR
jgi:hypothetical protein